MLAVVFGSLGALIGLALLLAGLALVLAQAFARDDDGYYTSDTKRLATPTYALTVEDIDLGSDPVDFVPKDVLGRVRIRAERPGGGAVFLGIGPEREVDAYLRGVGHAEVEDLSDDPPRYLTRRGGAPRSAAVRRAVLGRLLGGAGTPGGQLGSRGRTLVGRSHER